ncbi:putative regulator of septum formation [Lentzea atacamensis]|uniref:Regulator of septum formation n=1 Tax=Lentzea atacamensis TaxID=531938 RepID=A0ABX9EFK6_9PSEU|nr:septum formation family protein [Lentzea atacamensis]RAS68198.1 putative regulator of septum formation [Lentzea atacamensis]
MTRVRLAVAIILSAVGLSACAIQVGGQAVPGPMPSTAAADTPTLPKVGQCMNSSELKAIDCAASHDAEVMAVGEMSGMPSAYPDTQALRKAALPPCYATINDYLGSQDAGATRLQVWAFWPNEASWKKGERWRLCTVVELAPEGKALARKGSLKGVLKGSSFNTYQICLAGSPSKDSDVKPTACNGPHMAEAVPAGIVPLGKYNDPTPSKDQMSAIAKDKCTKAVHDYVGSDKRTDVFPAWRMPGSQGWSEGWTYAICYAEATKTFNGTLLGLRDNPLPN